MGLAAEHITAKSQL